MRVWAIRRWLQFAFVLLLAIGSAQAFWGGQRDWIALKELPPEARETLTLIKQGGPFPYKRDGIVFQNREKRLPLKQRGYYREYTVRTPGLKHRGPKRIVAGEEADYYYTEDHYETFRRIRE
jgi:ribonuclease T1